MILSEDHLQNLLDQTIPRIREAANCAVVLEGSIAEGFGNTSSDIDFLLIADSDADLPTMPSLLFLDGRRVEVRTRSVRQLTEQFSAVTSATHGHPGALSEDLLNRCQRLLRSFPLRNPDLVAKVKGLMSFEDFQDTMREWWAHHARQSIRHALALRELGQDEEAAAWTEAGLLQAVKSWAAGRGRPIWSRSGCPCSWTAWVTSRCAPGTGSSLPSTRRVSAPPSTSPRAPGSPRSWGWRAPSPTPIGSPWPGPVG
ncbi:hypothetical protein ACFQ2Y_44760 [Streptomyces malaysiensis subsp. malaysiensis]